MLRFAPLLALAATLALASYAYPAPLASDAPHYTADGRLTFPANYREWVFLSSSVDLSYSKTPVHEFGNVFAPAAAYHSFLKNGVWPDKTVLIVEARNAGTGDPLAKSGQFQAGDVTGLEAHVKDVTRFKGGWGFFAFDGTKPANFFPYTASCYACHQAHAAADTTFVQFYPTLLPVARQHGTISPHYLADVAALQH